MARPERNNVDYFPFLCKEGKAIHYIEKKYGNNGYATWFKILRELAVTNYHYLNLSKKIDLMFLASKCNIDDSLLLEIINDLSVLEEIDCDLWSNNKIIWSQKFIDHIQDAYNKRNNKCITLDGLRELLSGLGVLLLVKDAVKPQSKEEERKLKKTKEKEEVLSFLNMHWESEIFTNAWITWKEYKKTQHNFKYKTNETEQVALDQLLKLSEGLEIQALEIIQTSIANGWKGFFQLKKKEVKTQTDIYAEVYKHAMGNGR